MIMNYISYGLRSSFKENNIDLINLTTHSNGVEYYKSNNCHELHLSGKILTVEAYLSFYENELLAITYKTSSQNIDYLVEFINSFAKHENEYLFEDVLGGNSDLFCIQNDVAIFINKGGKGKIDFKIAVPISKRKNNVFI